uniref:Uncharacterized protein n=1 Tax=Rhizophagus irregularis (strain DAOM 181602 / DAOM 197198 / MUCL 43194) TaxID=747089 RepID=U9T273_RHIID
MLSEKQDCRSDEKPLIYQENDYNVADVSFNNTAYNKVLNFEIWDPSKIQKADGTISRHSKSRHSKSWQNFNLKMS